MSLGFPELEVMFLCVKTLSEYPLSGFSCLLFAPFGVFTVPCILEELLDCKAEMPWGRDLIPFGVRDKAAKSVMWGRVITRGIWHRSGFPFPQHMQNLL